MASQRKLVTLRKISSLCRCKANKRYSLATIGGGWTVVIFHGSFEVGDLALYFEIDSFIPVTSGNFKWEDQRHMTEYEGQRGYHVASRMLAKHLSQGLLQRVSALPEVKAALDELVEEHGREKAMTIAQGMSFEDMLGVKKWEIPFDSKGQILGQVPKFFPRPACERVQNIPDLFQHKRLNTMFQITEKLDGVSMTVYRVVCGSKWHQVLPNLPEDSTQEVNGARLGVASASEDLDERGDDVYWLAAKRTGLPKKLNELGLGNVAVQGELIGPTVKNNSLQFDENAEHAFIVFQIFDIDRQEFVDSRKVVDMCKRLDVPHVPVFGYMRLKDYAASLDSILSKAEGVGMRGTTREGLVFKSIREQQYVFKVISNKWLLEQKE